MTMHQFVKVRFVSCAGTFGRRMWPVVMASLVLLASTVVVLAEGSPEPKQQTIRLIGATAMVTEVSTGLPLPARVDTGATTCSIHCDAMEIKDEDPDPKVNIGKPIRFLVKHKEGDQGEWVEAKIIDHVTVRTSTSENNRYKVSLRLRWEDVEKKVHVTLNDRQNMKYPLLLGRNFLRDDFLVNVSIDSQE